jgi:hypothetical protein
MNKRNESVRAGYTLKPVALAAEARKKMDDDTSDFSPWDICQWSVEASILRV